MSSPNIYDATKSLSAISGYSNAQLAAIYAQNNSTQGQISTQLNAAKQFYSKSADDAQSFEDLEDQMFGAVKVGNGDSGTPDDSSDDSTQLDVSG